MGGGGGGGYKTSGTNRAGGAGARGQVILTYFVNQTITFNAQTTPTRTYSAGGTFAISPTATASSGLAVSYSSLTTAVCTVAATTVTIVGAGTCTIAANQAGNTTYGPAPQVTQNVTINKANQTITFNAQTTPTRTYSTGGTFAISPLATTTSGLAIAYSSTTPSVCTVAGTTVTMVAVGTCTIAADQAGDANWNAATQATRNVTITKANQTITFNAQTPPTRGYSAGGTFAISPLATTTSGLTIAYSSTTPSVCTVAGTTVTIVAIGTCTIAADQAGDANWNAATQATQNVAITKADQTITFGPQAAQTYAPSGTFAINPLATTTSGLTITYSSSTPGVCTVAGTTVTIVAVGTCTIAADQAGDASFNAAPQVSQAILINPGAANKLAFFQQPSNSTVDAVISPAFTVQIQDVYGNLLTSDNRTVTLAESCAAAFGGTTSVAAISGVATFSDVSLDAPVTACQLTATSSPALTPATSVAFDVVLLPASQLVINNQPNNEGPGATMSPAITVEIQNAAGQVVTTSTALVTLVLGTNPGGSTLSGTTSVNAVAGTATFDTLSLNNVGNGYTLVASSSGLTGATSNPFNIIATTDNFGASGTWTAPPGVTSVTVEAWAGGGAGGSATGNPAKGGGGAGGQYAKKVVPVTPGSNYPYVIGAGGTGGGGNGPSGGDTTFAATTVVAKGGAGGASGTTNNGTANAGVGSATGGVGDTVYAGGSGSNGVGATQPAGVGGAGGGGAGSTGAGGNASGNTAGTGTATGGGAGANARTTSGSCTTGATVAGGGGCGGYALSNTNRNGGSGARGQISMTYVPATVIADGTNPANVTLAPGAAITDLDAFTLVTSSGTDSVTGLTVTLSGTNAFDALSEVRITNNAGTTTYFTAVTNPTSDTIVFSGGTPITATTTVTTYKVRITPKTHANMPVPPGFSYDIGGTVTAFTSSRAQTGTDGASSTMTIDNLSPASATATSGTPASASVSLNWTTSSAADFNTTAGSVLYRWTNSVGPEVPAEGSTPTAGGTNGTATVACVISSAASTPVTAVNGTGGSAGCSTAALSNGTAYVFKIFQKDSNGNYDAGATIGTFVPNLVASKVAFTQQPTSTASGATITPAITVQIQDAAGNLVSTSTASVTLAIATNPGGGTLGGTLTVNAVAGVATFNNLSINNVGTGYTLSATSASLTAATSNAFNITSAAATKLAFYQQPSNTTVSTAISPAVTVQIQDASGNLVSSDTRTITVSKSVCGGTLGGTTSVAAVGGVATFSNLTISAVGSGCTLTATASPALTPDTSVAFDITALPASKLAFSVQPSKTAPNTAISPAVTVLIQDSANNTITTSTATVTLAIGANPGSGTLAGTTSVAAVAGVATFSNLSINSIGTGYTLTASSSGLTGATSNTFNITTATKLAFFQQPSNTSASSSISPAVTVQIQDAGGTLVSTSSDTVTLAIGTNPGGGTLSGSLSVAAVAGVATFGNLSINAAGVGYTLTANAPGLTGATSVSFNIDPLVCFTDNFADLANWSVGNEGGSFGNPVATSNRLRMTDASGVASTYATLQRLFPAFGNKVVVEFQHYAYGGTNPGADGIGIVLSDASQAPAAGAFGGSLGYAPKRTDQSGDTTHPGFVGGWLGVAIDEWGNFSANTEGRTGGSAPGRTQQSVAVRGSGSGYTGYSYLGGTGASPGGYGIDLAYATQTHLATLGPGYKYRIIIDHSDAVHAYTSVERDLMQGGGYTYLVSPFDAKAQPGQAAVPTQWYLSVAGATGGSNNVHEIANLSVCSNSQNTIALDHIEIDHDGSGFPGIAESITIKACADAACTTLYLNSVTVDLSAANASGTGTNTWSTNPVTFTGGQTNVTLTHQVATTASVTLGITSSTPTVNTPANNTCRIGASVSCTMMFSPVSFDAVQPAAVYPPASAIFTKLAGVSFNLQVLAITNNAINTGFTGAVAVDLVDPYAASGTCTDANTGLTTATNYTFIAGDNGRHTFTFNYPYAASNAKVRIRFGGNSYCSSDNFVIRPQVLTLSTTSSLNPASNTLAAGADFNLTANAGVTAGYAGSIPVKDPSLATIRDHQSPTPQPITAGSLTGNFTVGTGTMSVGTFQYQDVGTLTFQANAVIDSQFFNQDQHTGVYAGVDHGTDGDCVYNSTSNTVDGNGRYGCNIGSTALGPLGKFIPDHFTLTAGSITAGCPAGGYSYMGQPFGIAYTLEARNLADVVTPKYTTSTLSVLHTPPSPVLVAEDGGNAGIDLASRLGGLPTASWGNPTPGKFILNTAAAVFSRPTTPVALDTTSPATIATTKPNAGGPFDLLTLGVRMVDGTAVIANRDMNAATSTDCAVAVDCDALKLPTNNPLKMRFGILRMDSATGSQQLNMKVPVRAMYMSTAPSQFVVNDLDSNCTSIPPASIAIGNQTPAGFSANFNNANRPVSATTLTNGAWYITLTKPSAGASGKADIALNLGATGVTADVSCNTTHPATDPANLPWLQGKWGGSVSCPSTLYDRDPNASVSFGTNRSVFIYMRERY